jgi:hypothetical protein
MLDISVPELRKEKKLDEKKFLDEAHVTVLEKFDGTKLTLVRNRLPRNKDYALNWTVSYKGSKIFPEEFAGVSDDMLQHSIGMCQYKRVFDHLRSLPLDADVEMGLELFIEFIQNKPTLTRDYERFGDMFLIGYDTCEDVTLGLRTYTTSCGLHIARNKELAEKLRLKLPPVLHEGALSKKFASVKDVVNAYSDMSSSLGGKAEGVVIMHVCEMYKVVAPDQYSKEVRRAKKMRYALEEPGESEYWTAVKTQARQLVQRHWSDDVSMMMRYLSCTCYRMTQSEFKGQNPKKNTVMLADDLMLSAKLAYEEMRELRGTRVGVIPMAGRPVHAGHWFLIENALKENDTVYLFVSVKGRGEGLGRIEPGTMMRAWKEVLLPALDKRVIVRFVESPVFDSFRFVKDALNPTRTFTFYGDEDDVAQRWNAETLSKQFPHGIDGRVRAVGFKRSDTMQISATEVRKMLADHALMSRITATFPKALSEPAKKRYFKILTEKA